MWRSNLFKNSKRDDNKNTFNISNQLYIYIFKPNKILKIVIFTWKPLADKGSNVDWILYKKNSCENLEYFLHVLPCLPYEKGKLIKNI